MFNSPLFAESVKKVHGIPMVMEWSKSDGPKPTDGLENVDQYGLEQKVVDEVIKYIKERTWVEVIKDVRADELLKQSVPDELIEDDCFAYYFHNMPIFHATVVVLDKFATEVYNKKVEDMDLQEGW